MHFVYGVIVGLVIAAAVAFVLYRAVIVAKLKAASTQAEQAAKAEAAVVCGAARDELQRIEWKL